MKEFKATACAIYARIWLGGHNVAARAILEPLVAAAQRPPTGPLDAAIIAPQSADEAIYFAKKLAPRLRPSGALYIVQSENDSNSAESRWNQATMGQLAALGFVNQGAAAIAEGLAALVFRLEVA